jgi:hypothetical protein
MNEVGWATIYLLVRTTVHTDPLGDLHNLHLSPGLRDSNFNFRKEGAGIARENSN